MALWRVRATIDDRPGFLAVLAASLALRSVNILAVQVHTSEAGAIDDFLVDAPADLTERDLLAAVERGRGRDVWVARADPHTLVDAPTRALDLAGRVLREPALVREALADLLDAQVSWCAEAGLATAVAGLDGRQVCLPAPGGAWLAARPAPDFTPAEYARAQALVAVATAAGPHASQSSLLLADGREVTVRRAVPADVDSVRGMHQRCSAATLRQRYLSGAAAPATARLRRLLIPACGWTLVAATRTGGVDRVVAMGNLLVEGRQAELALLVEDAWQRCGLGTALLRKLMAGAVDDGVAAVLVHTLAENGAMRRTLRRLGVGGQVVRDGALLTVTVPVVDPAGHGAPISSATVTTADTNSGPASRE